MQRGHACKLTKMTVQSWRTDVDMLQQTLQVKGLVKVGRKVFDRFGNAVALTAQGHKLPQLFTLWPREQVIVELLFNQWGQKG